MEKELAPIVIFVYARPDHTKRMMESLQKNTLAKQSKVWVFSDNAKNEKSLPKVQEVREYIHQVKNENHFQTMEIVEAPKNKGLANSVIAGVSQLIDKYGKAIVIEDDLVLTENFLEYMNEALEFYEKDTNIWSISGYTPPIEIPSDYDKDVYLGYRGCSWGWATWKDRWELVDWEVKDYSSFRNNSQKRKQLNRGGDDMAQMLDLQMEGEIDSWAIRWCYEQSKRDTYTIYPTKSLVYNCGLDGSGTHSKRASSKFLVQTSNEKRNLETNLVLDKRISRNFKKQFTQTLLKAKAKELLRRLKMEKVIQWYQKRK